MTTPTGTISLSAVQAEFGGIPIIALGEYYRGGSYVSPSTAAGTSGVQIATSGTIRLGDFRGVTADALSAANWMDTGIYFFRSGATASVTATFQNTGSCTGTGINVQQTNDFNGKIWGSGITPANYWVKFTPTSGTLSTNGASAFSQMSSARAMSLSNAIGGTTRACTVRVDFSNNSSGSPIVKTGFIYLEAEVI